MDRIFLHYSKWECYKDGLYHARKLDEKLIKSSYNLLSDAALCNEYFFKVIVLWPNSSKHNLSDHSTNGRAFIGQSACCISHKANHLETKSAWNQLSLIQQRTANKIAENVIKEFRNKLEKYNQLCLKFI